MIEALLLFNFFNFITQEDLINVNINLKPLINSHVKKIIKHNIFLARLFFQTHFGKTIHKSSIHTLSCLYKRLKRISSLHAHLSKTNKDVMVAHGCMWMYKEHIQSRKLSCELHYIWSSWQKRGHTCVSH